MTLPSLHSLCEAALFAAPFTFVGTFVPNAVDLVLKRARIRYRSWTEQASKAYADFVVHTGRHPERSGSPQERALSDWGREAYRLSLDRMMSDEELGQAILSGACDPNALSETSPPTEKELSAIFSFNRSFACRAAAATACGTLAAAYATVYGPSLQAAAGSLFALTCLAMALADAKSRTITLGTTAAIGGAALLWLAVQADPPFLESTLLAAVCAASMAAVNASARARGRPRPIGGGDVKTLPLIVAAVSPSGLTVAALAGSTALLSFLLWRFAKQGIDLGETIPLGPFMAIMGIAGTVTMPSI